jgi:hypothetical protein
MQEHEATHLERRLRELHSGVQRLAAEQPVDSLISIIHKPGWTTVAEFELFTGLVEAMIAHTNSLAAMRQALFSGASKVELNPQPLPPKE